MGVKDTANLAMIPAAYAEDKVYSVLPSDGDGDFTFTRTGSGTRINKGGYIETMAENVPRLNYRLDADGNPTGCPELLLEESRQSSSIEKFPNDWFRCSLTHTPTTTTRLYRIGTYNGGITYAGTGTDFVYLWGAQLELGSTISSYIPTTSSAITRNKDSAYNQPFGDLASDYPITVFWKGQITNYNAGTFAFSIYDNGSNARYLGLAWNSTSNFYLYRRSTSNDADLVSYTTQIGDVKKIAIKFTSNTTAKVYIDGIEIYNLSSGLDVDWDFDSVLVGQQSVISDGGKRIPADELFVWNKALTDAEMVDVTSYDTFAEMATGQQFTIQ
jgi:hypothetical protein